jgi:hypothetical protein
MNVYENAEFTQSSAGKKSEAPSQQFRILDATEAAAIIRMDSRTLIRWARLGYVPAHPLGEGKRRLWRFIEAELLEWFEQRSVTQKRSPARSIDSAINARARRTA